MLLSRKGRAKVVEGLHREALATNGKKGQDLLVPYQLGWSFEGRFMRFTSYANVYGASASNADPRPQLGPGALSHDLCIDS